MTAWPSALGRVRSRGPIRWRAIVLAAALAFLIGLAATYLLSRKTTGQRIASAAQARWQAATVSCAKHEPIIAIGLPDSARLPHPIYSCVIGSIPAGLAPSNQSTVTKCYGISKSGRILDVTNVVFLRRNGTSLGLPCK
jgi:hypothetical protein